MALLRQIYIDLCRIFIGSFIVIGVVVAFVIPPFQVPDEPAHLESAQSRFQNLFEPNSAPCSALYDIARHYQNGLVAFHPKVKFPRGLYETVDKISPVCVKAAISYGNVLTYPGFLAAKILVIGDDSSGQQATLAYYLARILQGLLVAFVLWRIFVHLSSKDAELRPGVLSVLVVCVSPIFMQQSFAISADGVVNAFVLSLVTWVLFFDRLDRVDLAIFSILGFAASATKPIIAPLIIPVVLISVCLRGLSDQKRFGSVKSLVCQVWKRPYSRWALAVGALLTIFCIYVALSDKGTFQSPSKNAAQQIAFLKEAPFKAAGILISGTKTFSLSQILFSPLGWLDTALSRPAKRAIDLFFYMGLTFDVCLTIFLIYRKLRNRLLTPRHAMLHFTSGVFLMIAVFVSAILTVLALYIGWTPPRAEYVLGLQPRYFIPQYFVLVAALAAMSGFIGLPANGPARTAASGLKGVAAPSWAQRAIRTFVAMAFVTGMLLYLVKVHFFLAFRYW